MVGTVATGFLGMNLFNHTDMGVWEKIVVFLLVFVPTILLTAYTVLISRRLALSQLGGAFRPGHVGRVRFPSDDVRHQEHKQ